VVRFVLRGGQTVVIRGTIGTDNPPEYHAGEKVMVYYDPRHPQTAVIGSWGDVWFFPLTQIVLTSFFALAMASPFLRQLRRARAMREAFP
jgi:hypothetical protein